MSDEFKNRKAKRQLDRVEREKKNAAERARKSKKGYRSIQLKYRYGITEAQYNNLVWLQNGLCACCKVRLPVDVDHCHDSKVIRGILCRACNVGIGLLGDTLDGVLRAVQYLTKDDKK